MTAAIKCVCNWGVLFFIPIAEKKHVWHGAVADAVSWAWSDHPADHKPKFNRYWLVAA